MVAGILEKSKRFRKALFFIVKKLPCQAQPCAAITRGMWGAHRAALTYLRRCCEPVKAENTTGRRRGQSFPQTPCKAFRHSEFVIFRASSLRPFPFRLPTEQCPSFPAGLARDE